MKVLCFSISLLLYIFEFICSHHLNVGTVLFTKADLCRKCWSESERTLLIARQVMQGVLPDPDFMDITKAGTLTVILEYFQSCFDVIGQSTCGKTQHLMFLALSDALGGYLRSYILPITRQAYYAGQVKYLEASRIYQFYDEIRDFLKTNGAGWAKPRRFGLTCKIRPLKITTKGCDAACAQLYLKEEIKEQICGYSTTEVSNETLPQPPPQVPPSGDTNQPSPSLLGRYLENDAGVRHKIIDVIRGVRNQKYADNNPSGDDESRVPHRISLNGRNVQKIEKIRKDAKRLRDRLISSKINPVINHPVDANRSWPVGAVLHPKLFRKREGACMEHKHGCCCNRELMIPLPVLDDPEKPHAIGLPFKVRPLRSLDSPHAICILVRYYITVIKCLVTKSNDRCDIFNFNGQFETWLALHIFPHLSDEEWYPAFGGVLRIVETIKDIGCDECGKPRSGIPNDIGFMFSKGFAFDETDYLKNEECPECDAGSCRRREERTYLTLGILAIVTIWIMAFCYYICCYCPAVKTNEEDICRDDEVDNRRETDPSNSFIVQCLIKFFKRAVEEDRKHPDSLKKEDRVGNYDYERDDSEVELLDRRLSPSETHRKGNEESSTRVESREGRRKSGHGRETIVLPAQIAPINTELPMGLTSFWPFTDFREDIEVMKPHTEDHSKPPPVAQEPPAMIPKRGKEQFKTIWKREKSPDTSESCSGIEVKNVSGTHGNDGNGKDRAKEKVNVQEDSTSKSSYNDNSESEDDNRKRIMFVRRSQSRFNYPDKYGYSYNSFPNSYSSSQMYDDVRMEFYDHIMACHNSFAKRSRPRRGTRSDTDSKRGLTSSSTSESSSSEKRGRK